MNKNQFTYSNLLKFLFRNIKASAFLGFKLLRNFVIVNPAVEKTLSADVEVAGIHNNRLATDGRVLNLAALAFHHVRGFSFLGMGASAKYFSSSFSVL